MNLVKTIITIYSQGFYRNLFHIFLSLIVFSTYLEVYTNFWNFKEIKKLKTRHKVVVRLWPMAWHCWLSPAGKVTRCIGAAHGRSAVTTSGSRARWRDGALTDDAVVADRQQGFLVSTRRHAGWHWAIGGAAGFTRTATHQHGQKTGLVAMTSTSAVISGERWQHLKAPAAPGSPRGGEGQDQSAGRGSEVALTEMG
jgi:hypothetical protein